MISGVGEQESATSSSNYTDSLGITGAAYGNVIIAARNNKASNSRGVRAFLGAGAFRTNLTSSGSWWFTTAGHALVAIQFAGPTTQIPSTEEIREVDPNATGTGSTPSICYGTGSTNPTTGCCPWQPPAGTADCWAPLVVQTAQLGTGSGQYSSLSSFESAVTASTRTVNGHSVNTWTYANGTLTYYSLAGDEYVMSRQATAASLPQVYVGGTGSNVITVAPTSTYAENPPAPPNQYLSMSYGNATATLCPPSFTGCVTRNFT
jgi:hypothetical protein